jgi:phosphate transport system ATP-binding protein
MKRLEIQNLRLSYHGIEVLHGLNFDVMANEILAIIGPAQSGKTSLLRCLNRTIDFIPHAALSGSVSIDGELVTNRTDFDSLRRRIGMVTPLPVGLPLSIRGWRGEGRRGEG